MTNRTWIQIIAGVVVAVFTVGLWATGVPVEAAWLRPYSAAVATAGVMWKAWDLWLWRLPVLSRMQAVPPVLHGTWKGQLTSMWTDRATDARPDPKPVFIVVRQTASSVSVVLMTDESRSKSMLAHIDPSPGIATLAYLYLARPDMSVDHRSRMHHGAVMLDITGAPATRLRGRYWTDRDSRGELDFTDRVPKLAEDFAEAEGMFTT